MQSIFCSLKIIWLNFWCYCCIHDAGAHIIKNLRITTYCLRLIYILLRNLKLVVIIRVQCLHRYKNLFHRLIHLTNVSFVHWFQNSISSSLISNNFVKKCKSTWMKMCSRCMPSVLRFWWQRPLSWPCSLLDNALSIW